MNLGYALEVPADKGGGRADYTAALDCYRAALEVFTPDRNRIEHDKTQRNLDRVIKSQRSYSDVRYATMPRSFK